MLYWCTKLILAFLILCALLLNLYFATEISQNVPDRLPKPVSFKSMLHYNVVINFINYFQDITHCQDCFGLVKNVLIGFTFIVVVLICIGYIVNSRSQMDILKPPPKHKVYRTLPIVRSDCFDN